MLECKPKQQNKNKVVSWSFPFSSSSSSSSEKEDPVSRNTITQESKKIREKQKRISFAEFLRGGV
jgi:hypothetical protein